MPSAPATGSASDLARRHDLWVIADEVYAELVFEGTHTSIAGLDGMADRTVTVSSLSKSHAMTGWRIGWAIGPPELVGHFNNLGMAMAYGLPGFIQTAAHCRPARPASSPPPPSTTKAMGGGGPTSPPGFSRRVMAEAKIVACPH